jgi:hypothetical protein
LPATMLDFLDPCFRPPIPDRAPSASASSA